MEDSRHASAVAAEYVNAYFTHLSTKESRPKLASLYREKSTVTYGDIQISGIDEITRFLQALPLEPLEFKITDLKVCPSAKEGMLVLATGISHFEDTSTEVVEAFYLDLAENGDFFISSQIVNLLNTPPEDVPP